MRNIRAAACSLVATISCLTAFAAPALAQESTPGGPAIEVSSMDPAVVTDASDVTAHIHLGGISVEPGQPAWVSVLMTADSLSTYDQIDSFLEGGSNVWSVTELTLTGDERQRAATAEGADLTVTLPAEELPLWNPSDWGAYGVEVRAFNSKSRTNPVVARSLLFWFPTGTEAKGYVNILIPDTPTSDAAWEAASAAGQTLALTPRQTQKMAQRQDAPAEVLVLPVESADMSMLAAADQTLLYSLAQTSREDPQLHALAPRVDVLNFPVLAQSDWLCEAVLQRAGEAPVLGPPASATSGASYQLAGGPGGLVPSWGALSAALVDPLEPGENEFLRIQRLRALTALNIRDNTESASYFWANVGDHADVSVVSERFAAALDVPWAEPATLRQILETATGSADAPESAQGNVSQVKNELDPLAHAVELARAVLGDEGERLQLPSIARIALAPTAIGLSDEERGTLAASATSRLNEKYDVIEVAASRTVNVLAAKADFPVTLTNKSERDMNVGVALRVDSPRLRADEAVEVEVPAGSSRTANVPIEAVGAGNVQVEVVATAPNGVVLDTSAPMLVRVRPGLGDTLTWVTGLALGSVFLTGLVRTLRKPRRGTEQAASRLEVGADVG